MSTFGLDESKSLIETYSKDEIDLKENNTNTEISSIITKLNTADTKFSSIDTKINGINTEIDSIDTEIDSIDTEINNLKSNKLDKAKTSETIKATDPDTGIVCDIILKRIGEYLVYAKFELSNIPTGGTDAETAVVFPIGTIPSEYCPPTGEWVNTPTHSSGSYLVILGNGKVQGPVKGLQNNITNYRYCVTYIR